MFVGHVLVYWSKNTWIAIHWECWSKWSKHPPYWNGQLLSRKLYWVAWYYSVSVERSKERVCRIKKNILQFTMPCCAEAGAGEDWMKLTCDSSESEDLWHFLSVPTGSYWRPPELTRPVTRYTACCMSGRCLRLIPGSSSSPGGRPNFHYWLRVFSFFHTQKKSSVFCLFFVVFVVVVCLLLLLGFFFFLFFFGGGGGFVVVVLLLLFFFFFSVLLISLSFFPQSFQLGGGGGGGGVFHGQLDETKKLRGWRDPVQSVES